MVRAAAFPRGRDEDPCGDDDDSEERVGDDEQKVGLDSVIELVINGEDGEIVFELFEGLLHLGEPSAGGGAS